jgi:hypothetical protein
MIRRLYLTEALKLHLPFGSVYVLTRENSVKNNCLSIDMYNLEVDTYYDL